MELMKLDEAKEIIRKELQKDIVWLRNNEKNNDYFADKYRKEANAYHTVLQELDRLQKENEELSCVKKAIKVYKTNVGTENCQFVLMSESEFLNSFNYKCLLDDYISKDKIRDKIEEIERKLEYEDNESVQIYLYKQKRVLQDLLKEE